jgi:hypothetical protein
LGQAKLRPSAIKDLKVLLTTDPMSCAVSSSSIQETLVQGYTRNVVHGPEIFDRKYKLRFWKHTDTCQCNAASAEVRGGLIGAAAAEDIGAVAAAAEDLGAEQTGIDLGDDVAENATANPAVMAAAVSGPAANLADTATARSAAAAILNLGDDEAAAAKAPAAEGAGEAGGAAAAEVAADTATARSAAAVILNLGSDDEAAAAKAPAAEGVGEAGGAAVAEVAAAGNESAATGAAEAAGETVGAAAAEGSAAGNESPTDPLDRGTAGRQSAGPPADSRAAAGPAAAAVAEGRGGRSGTAAAEDLDLDAKRDAEASHRQQHSGAAAEDMNMDAKQTGMDAEQTGMTRPPPPSRLGDDEATAAKAPAAEGAGEAGGAA